MEQIKLNVAERLALLDILPREGDLTTIKLVRQLRENLSFTEREHAVLQFRAQDKHVQWLQNYGEGVPVPEGMTREEAMDALAELADGVSFDIGIKAVQVARETLEKLNEEGKLTEQHLGLCEKFEITE